MNINVIALFSLVVLLAFLFIALWMIVRSPRRRLSGAGLLMGSLLLAMGIALLVPWLAFRSEHHIRRTAGLELVRWNTEAAARRHADEMRRVDEEVRRTFDWAGNVGPLEAPESVSIPVQAPVVTELAAPRPPTTPEAPELSTAAEVPEAPELSTAAEVPVSTELPDSVGEIASPDEVQILSGAGDARLTASEAALRDDGASVAVAEPAESGHDDADTVAADTVTADTGSPDWVQQPPQEVDGHLALVLTSDPFEDRFSCDEDLERRTRGVIAQAARQRCRQRGLPLDLPIDVTYDEIGMVSQRRHYQTRSTSVGDMVQAYQLTVMDDAFQAKLDRRIADALVDRRLAAVGLASGGVLGVVSLLFGAFRFTSRKVPDPLSA